MNQSALSITTHPTSTLYRLRAALDQWRTAERNHARAVLAACHPVHLRKLKTAERNARRVVRELVDSEPWPAILEEDLNLRASAPLREKGC